MARCYEPVPPTPLHTRFSLTHGAHEICLQTFLDMFKFTAFPPNGTHQPAFGLCDTSRGVC